MNDLIEVLPAGRHVDASGVVVTFSEQQLQDIVAAYDRCVFDTPLVIGHPKMEDPAYGWANRFVISGGKLCAEPCDIDPEFAELVKAKRYKKVSLSLYSPDSPNNPKPGTWYPRHIGFLGAHPPAIKGLKSVSFGEADEYLTFGEGSYVDGLFVQFMRGMRDWLLGDRGQDTADKAIPAWLIDEAQRQVITDQVTDPDTTNPILFNEPPEDAMSAELQAQLDAANQKIKDQQALIDANIAAAATAKKAKLQADAVSFAESVADRVPAERKNMLVSVYTTLGTENADGKVLHFGEGEQAKPTLDDFKAWVESLPKSVTFGEHAKSGQSAGGKSPGELAQAAQDYMSEQAAKGITISSAQAVKHVQAQA